MNTLSRRKFQIATRSPCWACRRRHCTGCAQGTPGADRHRQDRRQQHPAGGVRLDMKMIEALPQHSFTTRTPWYDKPVKFTGPLLADVLKLVKAQGQTIGATAINDYRITIPASDASQHGVIMARLIDDQPIPVREKGPLFIVYPFDTSATLRSSVYYERSIWQLKALDIQ
jgi:hypothetical protein